MKKNIFIIFLIFIIIFLWHGNHVLNSKLSDSEDELSSYEDALDKANSNIEDAKSSAWDSYEEMGQALDDLDTVNP